MIFGGSLGYGEFWCNFWGRFGQMMGHDLIWSLQKQISDSKEIHQTRITCVTFAFSSEPLQTITMLVNIPQTLVRLARSPSYSLMGRRMSTISSLRCVC